MARWLSAVLVVGLAFGSLPARAEGAESRSPGAREHDGLFLQLQTGPAYLNLFDATSSIGGPGFGLHVLAGFSPVRNLVVFGEVSSQAAGYLRASRGIEEASTGGSMSLTYLGPGIAHYLGDSGVHLGGGIGLALVTLDGGLASDASEGVGLRVGLGKEWWISDALALGVAFNFFTARVELDDGTATLDRSWRGPLDGASGGAGGDGQAAQSYGLSFTATYQ